MVAPGTSVVSKSLLAMYLATPQTAGLELRDFESSSVAGSSRSPLLEERRSVDSQIRTVDKPLNVESFDRVVRRTSEVEKLIGEVRAWVLFGANWDGEGANAPSTESLRQAVAFVRLLSPVDLLPDATLHASGRAGLFWNADGMVADLEFLGQWRIAFYVERDDEKVKGTTKFKPNEMPALLASLLRA